MGFSTTKSRGGEGQVHRGAVTFELGSEAVFFQTFISLCVGAQLFFIGYATSLNLGPVSLIPSQAPSKPREHRTDTVADVLYAKRAFACLIA